MTVQKIIPYGSYSEGKVTAILTDYANLSTDTNATAMALKNYFIFSSNATAKELLEFNSYNKYSAITFSSGETYVLGAADYINLKNKTGVLIRVGEYAKKGFRVLVIAKSQEGIKDNKVSGECEPIGMVVLQDHIKPDAIKTFQWFNENGVAIRVISWAY
jgi:cation-transporting ATPase E